VSTRIHIRIFSFFVSLAVLSGCTYSYTPPSPAAPRQPTQVSASEGKTWDAVIELFAERTIPIRTMERASGFIATEVLLVNDPDRRYADCGSRAAGYVVPEADKASYNVLVRGDSTASTVRVTARFIARGDPIDDAACSTTGRWEEEMEGDIKAVAEGRPIPVTSTRSDAPACVGDEAVREGDDFHVTVHLTSGSQPCATVKQCKYREAALNMSKETAINRCRAEAKREP
jgi:hypothetical protein